MGTGRWSPNHRRAWHAQPRVPPVDDVLEDLVEGVTDVQVTIGIGGPIMQCERRLCSTTACREAVFLTDLLSKPYKVSAPLDHSTSHSTFSYYPICNLTVSGEVA
jgi:hypothetical protein